ncbi:hypothetical protein B0J13DRAFT_623463 [Dactylonectria estremocensis]|uniref:FAD/NAD(P)-binding domain-containing protein n=1 Tax=Dactylonectria estremocensis TaxID=1079267 RepID=A0A9P9J5C1_9HYPO|nr:hypothetical protein B0J13DRAFT_623463 [Dactylonectria estremocensis]
MTATDAKPSSTHEEHPPRAELRTLMAEQPVPILAPGTVDAASMAGEQPTKQALTILNTINAALAADDAEKLESCFHADQAYWRDQLALTYHLRTFNTPSIIVASLLETKKLRDLTEGFKLEGAAVFIPATPVLQFIDCSVSFRTSSPAAIGSGRILLWPVKSGGSETIQWKVWILSTKLDSLEVQPEDKSLLQAPRKALEGLQTIETDVFIIGGGNSAAALAARLKALGVESVMADRNARPGDNWALRYDCMKFHIPTSFCDLPYMSYDKELQTPHLLIRDELAEQVRRYITEFNLNIITSAKIQSTTYNLSTKRWSVKLVTPAGQLTTISKHLVQATGIGSQKHYIPPIADHTLYKGISIHSAHYKNPQQLEEQGAESVYIIGSANTAFDILEDCHSAGLQSTMVVRSPTYIIPLDYLCDKRSLGLYDFGVEAADRMFLTLPFRVDSQLGRNLFAHMASQEPDRYKALAATGFPVLDSSDPNQALMHNLIEKAGGHYVDVGTSNLIAEGKVGIKANVEPVAFTETGLRFSDGSTVDTDAIIWCTGFADKDARNTVADILGGGTSSEIDDSDLLGTGDIASRIDPTWGVDAEGEIRGMWKRHSRLENFWIMGGYTQQHRWFSRTLALQIKAELEGLLPPAYRGTPAPRT